MSGPSPHETPPPLKVILLSGYAGITGLAQGDVILGKPVGGDRLAPTVRDGSDET
jgi:hypothetical protein